MEDTLIEQVVQTLSEQMRKASDDAVSKAPFANFRTATIHKLVGDHTYRVSIDDRLIDIPVYGDCSFERGERVYVVSPRNSANYHDMFVLGKTIDASAGSIDHKTLMEVVAECDRKLDKSAVVQEEGQGTNIVMSQKAVTDALEVLRTNGSIKQIISGNTVLSATNEGTVTIPFGDAATPGVVKSSTDENRIKIGSSGLMELNSVDIMRVNQHNGDIVVLTGGKAE